MSRSSKNTRTGLPLPDGKYRWDDKLGKYLLHESLFVAHPQNPREALGDQREKLLKLMESIRSTEHGGVHLPVSGYIANNQYHVIEGHRRVFAVRHIIRDILAGVTEGQSPPDIDRYAYIPVTIEPANQSKLSILIRMQSSDSLKDEWNFGGRLDHIQHIYDEYQAEKGRRIPIEELPRSLAQSIGWPYDKMHLMIRISQSQTLRTAIAEYASCTFKTWREVVKIASVLVKNRTSLMEQITGLRNPDEEALTEATYRLLVGKVRYYVGEKKKGQAGAQLNRCIPPLRNDDFPPERIKDWLTKDIDLTSNSYERETESSKRTDKLRLFVEKFQPNLTEPQLQERISTPSPSGNVTNLAMPSDGKVPYSPEGEHTELHARPSPDGDAPATSRTFQIQLPVNKKKAFSEVASQVINLLQTPDICDGFSPTEKALAQTVVTILSSGRKRRKTA